MSQRTAITAIAATVLALSLPGAALAKGPKTAPSNRGQVTASEARGGEDRAQPDATPRKATATPSKAPASKPARGTDKDRGRGAANTSPNGVANSGTIKISAIGETPDPSNNPHPGCGLRVDLYGFRAADYDLTIALHAPTGSGTLIEDAFTISESAQGSELNLTRSYDVAGLLPANDDGRWHLRVEVKKDGSPGNGAKTKMLWLECPVDEAAAAPDVAGDDADDADDTAVLGNQFVNDANVETADSAEVAASGADGLATTGGAVTRVVWIALALLSLGLGIALLTRPREHL